MYSRWRVLQMAAKQQRAAVERASDAALAAAALQADKERKSAEAARKAAAKGAQAARLAEMKQAFLAEQQRRCGFRPAACRSLLP